MVLKKLVMLTVFMWYCRIRGGGIDLSAGGGRSTVGCSWAWGDVPPFRHCNKKRLAIRHMNRPIFPTKVTIPSYDIGKYVGLRTYQHPIVINGRFKRSDSRFPISMQQHLLQTLFTHPRIFILPIPFRYKHFSYQQYRQCSPADSNPVCHAVNCIKNC